jgi:hypothetical protein
MASKKYSEELTMAAAQMESINSLYKIQGAARNAQLMMKCLKTT